jgi:hypothetical protein
MDNVDFDIELAKTYDLARQLERELQSMTALADSLAEALQRQKGFPYCAQGRKFCLKKPSPPTKPTNKNSMSEHTIKYTVTPFVDFSKETLGLDITLPSGQIAREVMNLKERAIREGLIALGWTPPGIADRMAEALRESRSTHLDTIERCPTVVSAALTAYENHKKGNTP